MPRIPLVPTDLAAEGLTVTTSGRNGGLLPTSDTGQKHRGLTLRPSADPSETWDLPLVGRHILL